MGATNIFLRVENAVFIGTFRDIFTAYWKDPVTVCYEIWGTTFHPCKIVDALVNKIMSINVNLIYLKKGWGESNC